MKTAFFALILTGIFSYGLWAYSLAVDPVDTGGVVVSNTAASPTKVLTKNANIKRTWLINTSTNTIYLVGPSTASVSGDTAAAFSISLTTGSFYLVGGSSVPFTPDGSEPYTGAMWAVSTGAGGSSLLRFRSE
jgi:hypothetical protein